MDTAADLLIQGVWLMVIGMSIVCAFLMSLVGLLLLMSRVIARVAPTEPVDTSPGLGAMPGYDDAARRIAAVTAALHTYRRRNRR